MRPVSVSQLWSQTTRLDLDKFRAWHSGPRTRCQRCRRQAAGQLVTRQRTYSRRHVRASSSSMRLSKCGAARACAMIVGQRVCTQFLSSFSMERLRLSMKPHFLRASERSDVMALSERWRPTHRASGVSGCSSPCDACGSIARGQA